jgi:HEAT repeat protein
LISLVETVKDKNEKVRRKAVASLGELLFYAAT